MSVDPTPPPSPDYLNRWRFDVRNDINRLDADGRKPQLFNDRFTIEAVAESLLRSGWSSYDAH